MSRQSVYLAASASFLLSFWALICLSGCGGSPQAPSDRAAVSGQLSIEGKPLKGGTINFYRKDDNRHKISAIINLDGSYKTSSAPIGENIISIETESVRFGGGMENLVPIPERYSDPATSDLSKEIVAGENEFSVDLKP